MNPSTDSDNRNGIITDTNRQGFALLLLIVFLLAAPGTQKASASSAPFSRPSAPGTAGFSQPTDSVDLTEAPIVVDSDRLSFKGPGTSNPAFSRPGTQNPIITPGGRTPEIGQERSASSDPAFRIFIDPGRQAPPKFQSGGNNAGFGVVIPNADNPPTLISRHYIRIGGVSVLLVFSMFYVMKHNRKGRNGLGQFGVFNVSININDSNVNLGKNNRVTKI